MAPNSQDRRRRQRALDQRWGLQTSTEEDFRRFQNRFIHLAKLSLDWAGIDGEGVELRFRMYEGHNHTGLKSDYFLEAARSYGAFMVVLQRFIWALADVESRHLDHLLAILDTAKAYSPGVDFGVVRRGAVVTLYPVGARELDSALVEESVEWLVEYPKVAEQFEQALRIVLAKDSDNYRGALDNLRWALEQLLKGVLGNRKPLEKQRDVLLPWLRNRGVHQQVVNMYLDLLKRFADYQNDAVKHGDDWQPAELEFMIYVTGALMRLVLQAAREVPADQ